VRIVIVELLAVVMPIFLDFQILSQYSWIFGSSFRSIPLFWIPFQEVACASWLFLISFTFVIFSISLLRFVKSSVFGSVHLSTLPESWTSCANFNSRGRKDIVAYKLNSESVFGVFVDSQDSLFQNREELIDRCEDSQPEGLLLIFGGYWVGGKDLFENWRFV